MDNHWRNTQRPARFFSMDARSISFLLVFLVHARIWTFVLAVVVMAIFAFLERRGLTFESALRSFRCNLLGKVRPANHRRAKRRWIDYG